MSNSIRTDFGSPFPGARGPRPTASAGVQPQSEDVFVAPDVVERGQALQAEAPRMRAVADGGPASAEPLKLIITAPDAAERDQLKKVFLQQDTGNRISVDLPLINGFAVEVSPTAIQILPDLGKVAHSVRVFLDAEMSIPEGATPIEGHPRGALGLDIGTRTMGVDKLWDKGIKGKGVTIAVIDTGIAQHPDVKTRIVGFKDLVNGRNEAYDDQGHGTHVAGICAGDGKSSSGRYKGAAPEASLVGIKVLDKTGSGAFSNVIAGIQWAIENKDKYGIGVINLSLGGRAKQGYKDDPVAQAIEAAAAAGIVPCVAAGNNGPVGRSINTPAHALDALTVGALDDMGTISRADDGLADFSSRGPTPFDALVKPDVLAPGVDITSADYKSTGYRTLSGTSMATPMVAGATALLRQARPDLAPGQIKDLFMQTAEPLPSIPDPNWQGKGSLDPVKALDAAQAIPVPAQPAPPAEGGAPPAPAPEPAPAPAPAPPPTEGGAPPPPSQPPPAGDPAP